MDWVAEPPSGLEGVPTIAETVITGRPGVSIQVRNMTRRLRKCCSMKWINLTSRD